MSISGNKARRAAGALLCLLLLGVSAEARDRSVFSGAAPPSLPEPNPLSVEVRQGETVQITLSAYSLTSPIIRYRIREKPRLGTLSPSPYVNGKTGLVTYTPAAGGGAGEDEFTYAVQSEAGFSAPETVKIKIVDSDPRLTAPLDVDFGELLAGEISRRQVTLENIGGGTAEGRVQVPEGWRVEGAADYKLQRGMKQAFTLVFTPTEQRAYSGEIVYSGDSERATDIKGSQVAPVELGAVKVALQREGWVRSGSIPLRNRTARVQTLQVKASPRLGVPVSVEVPANGTATIALKTKPDDFAPVDETVVIAGAGLVEVTAEAVPREMPEIPAAIPPKKQDQPLSSATAAVAAVDAQPADPPSVPDQQPAAEQAPAPTNYLRTLAVESVSPHEANLKWGGRTEGVAAWRVEAQELVVGGTGGKIQVRWVPLGNTIFTHAESGVSAHLAGLQPNTLYILRMTAVDAENHVLEFSGMLNLVTLPAPPGQGKAWLGWTVVVALAAAGFWWWRKKR